MPPVLELSALTAPRAFSSRERGTMGAMLTLAVLSPSDQPALLWYIVGGLYLVSGFLSNLIGAAHSWSTFKRSKEECVTRAELQTVHTRVDNFMPLFFKEVGKMSGELKQLINDNKDEANEHRRLVTEQLSSIERSLGRVEGATDHHPNKR